MTDKTPERGEDRKFWARADRRAQRILDLIQKYPDVAFGIIGAHLRMFAKKENRRLIVRVKELETLIDRGF